MGEFSHPVRVDPWPAEGVAFALQADQKARQQLAGRLGLDALDRFEASGRVERAGRLLLLKARLSASFLQTCVVTLEPFAQRVDDDVTLELRQAGEADDELDPEATDSVLIGGGQVDVGEILVEELALRLDPHPRAPGAALDALDAPANAESAESPPDDWRVQLARRRQALAG